MWFERLESILVVQNDRDIDGVVMRLYCSLEQRQKTGDFAMMPSPLDTLKKTFATALTKALDGDAETAQVIVNRVEAAATKHSFGKLGLEVLEALNQTATELHDKIVPQKEADTALSVLFKASEGAADVMKDFRAFHDELKVVSDALFSAECEAYLTITAMGQSEENGMHFVVDCNNVEKLVVLPEAEGRVEVRSAENDDMHASYSIKDARILIMRPIEEGLTLQDKIKLTSLKGKSVPPCTTAEDEYLMGI